MKQKQPSDPTEARTRSEEKTPMKKKPETPPPENSLDRLARLTRRILEVPKDEVQRRESERKRVANETVTDRRQNR
jgi:hypothetical protein